MSNDRLSRNLEKLYSNVKINALTLETFLNDKVFHQDGSHAGIYICIYKKDPRYVYIGKTNDFIRRWKEHERDLAAAVHCGAFQTFYTSHNCSLDDFEWNILDSMENDPEKIAIKERQRIRQYDNDNYHILLNTILYRR